MLQQIGKRGARRHVDDRALTVEAFARLNERFRFTIDAAASKANTKLDRFFSEQNCGLAAPWASERVYCNPPFSDIRPWVEKAWGEAEAELVVMLLPANRTEQGWWQDLIEPRRDRVGSPLRTEFIQGRLCFLSPGETKIKPNNRPPFGCCLLIWDNCPGLDVGALFG